MDAHVLNRAQFNAADRLLLLYVELGEGRSHEEKTVSERCVAPASPALRYQIFSPRLEV
jgi:hypothetical protein